MAAVSVNRNKIGGAKTLAAQDTLRQSINLLGAINGPVSEMSDAQIEEWSGLPAAQATLFKDTVFAIHALLTTNSNVTAFLNQVYGADGVV